MGKVRRLFALSVSFAVVFGLVGIPAGSAVPAAQSPKFVGSYALHITFNGGGGSDDGTLTVNADGTATGLNGQADHWRNHGRTFTLTYHHRFSSQVYVGVWTKQGISTEKSPGTLTQDGESEGSWYAVKLSPG